MGREFLLGMGLFILTLGYPVSALAYTQTMTPSGHLVRWGASGKLNLAGNPANTSGLSETAVRASIVRGLQRWQAAGQGKIGFDYWQGSNPAVYQSNNDYNGYSNVYFASSGRNSATLSPNVLGLTQVWYNTDNGQILETDILLNDRDFRFTTNAKDTSGYGSGGTRFTGGKPNVFLENVITHELGHAFGLSHNEGLQSTMLFMESPEQAYLGCDDQLGIQAIYAAAGMPGRGTLSGVVTAPSGAPVFGAHVQVISQKRGVLLASGLTDSAGHYAISALEPGNYFLMVEPFAAGATALPSFYGAVNSAVCAEKRIFSRTFLLDSGGVGLIPVPVTDGANTAVPAIQVKCSSATGVAGASSAISAAVYKLVDGTRNERIFGILDVLGDNASHVYQLRGVSGHLQVHALSYSMYSPIRTELKLENSYGQEVASRISHPVYEGDSGFANFDAFLTAELPEPGDYFLSVTGMNMSSSMYPAGPMLLDGTPFVVLSGSLNDPTPNLAPDIPNNARCRMSEAFAQYSSPAGDPPRSSRDKDSGGVGFCGTVDTDAKRLKGDSMPGFESGASPFAIVAWFLPWLFMALIRMILLLGQRYRLARSPVDS